MRTRLSFFLQARKVGGDLKPDNHRGFGLQLLPILLIQNGLWAASKIPSLFWERTRISQEVRCGHENAGPGSPGQPSIYACRAAISYFTK